MGPSALALATEAKSSLVSGMLTPHHRSFEMFGRLGYTVNCVSGN